MDELKRCPFCGCDCELALVGDGNHFVYKVVGFHDEDCFFTYMHYLELFADEETAIETWNRRYSNKNAKIRINK